MIRDRQKDFDALRKKHPLFIYKAFTAVREKDFLRMKWFFEIPPEISFQPEMHIPYTHFNKHTPEDVLQALCFQLGLVELISYWKTSCPPLVRIEAGRLQASAIPFWQRLFYLGLGEFRYLNGIQCDIGDFVQFDFTKGDTAKLHFPVDKNKVLIPVGGGKDSAVSLTLISQSGKECIPFMINPSPASFRCLDAAGIPAESACTFSRHLDPFLLQLNKKAYLNGHTPFSALVAFASLIAATLTGAGQIALSNESSANESTIPGTDINHQYSKSFDFEELFRHYMKDELGLNPFYFSFLRPLNELQIAALFSGMTEFHNAFLSCNAGSRQDHWCGECPKCLFTAIILAPFLSQKRIRDILGKDIFEDKRLYPTLLELAGWSDSKPFECVGTVDEVQAGLKQAFGQIREPLPDLIRQIESRLKNIDEGSFGTLLRMENPIHALEPSFHHHLFSALQSRINETGW